MKLLYSALIAFIGYFGVIAGNSALAEDKTKLHFILCGGDEVKNLYQSVINEYELQNPDYKVDLELVAWGKCEPKALTLSIAGTPPELSYLGTRNIKGLASAGLIVPVDITPEKQNAFQSGVLRTVTYEGKFWAYPRAFSTKALFLNCAIFDKAGLPCKGPKTWDELYTTAKLIKEKTGLAGVGLTGKNTDSTLHQFLNYVYSNNGQLVDPVTGEFTLQNKEVLEALKFYGKLSNVSQSGATAHQRSNLLDLFNDDQIAMYINGPWAPKLHKADKNIVIAPLPAGPSGKGGSVLVADALFVHANTGNEKAAMKLASMLTSYKAQHEIDHPENWGMTPMYQYEKVGFENLYYKTDSARWKPFVDAIANGGPEPFVEDFQGVQGVIADMLQGIILKDDTPENLLAIATEELEEFQ